MEHSENYKLRLGLFVVAGFVLLFLAVFFIGKQRSLFNPVITLNTTFRSVSGLQVGNNVRFSGINVGTVEDIRILNDTTVLVQMLVEKDVKRFIKADCRVSIGSEGVIGDRIINITQSTRNAPEVNDGQALLSIEPVETDAIISSLKSTGENAAVLTGQLAEILGKINRGQGVLGKLIQDTSIAKDLDQTMENISSSAKGLNENMEAAKHNFLLRGFFKKKEKEEEEKQKKEQQVKNEKENKTEEK